MKDNMRRSLATKLSFGILLMAVPIFVLTLGLMFFQSRHLIRLEAKERVDNILNSTLHSVRNCMNTVETATNANTWLVLEKYQPDSLLAISRRIVMMNGHVHGCSITAEPDVFPQYGRYFSAYTVRKGDTIITEREAKYEYFDMPWYSIPRDSAKACWVDPFDDTNEGTLSSDDLIASYCKPLYDDSGKLLGVLSCDMSMRRLEESIPVDSLPFSHSYFLLIGGDGRYYIHPDSTRLYNKTIFTDIDPDHRSDIIALGHEMTSGNSGHIHVTIKGEVCHVCYAPVPGTSWSLAFVCPDRDILKGYNHLTKMIIPIIIVGLLIILLISRRIVAKTTRPLRRLLKTLKAIASGNYDVHIPTTSRDDVIGHLQNSFATMERSINFHIGGIRHTTEAMRKRNEELVEATKLAEKAVSQKTIFIQNVTHQIRTPLNIILGFAQVLRDVLSASSPETGNQYSLPEEELANILETMKYNSNHLERMVLMLYDSSDIGAVEELQAKRSDMVSCNEVAHEAIDYMLSHFFDKTVNFKTELRDDYKVKTSRLYLMRTIRELLYNAAKYSEGKNINLIIKKTDNKIRFIIEDEGTGISDTSRDMIFKPFTKADDLSEGLGLGLPLAKRHAMSLGGDLMLDTSYSGGCRFIIEIPC